MSPLLFVDTSVWYAFMNRGDASRPAAREVIRSFEGRLVTSNFVFDEAVTLCRQRLGHAVARQFGDALLSGDIVDLLRATPEDEAAAWDLFSHRPDQPYSFTDCISFAMMRRLHIRRAATFDNDFRREGFEVVP